LSAASIAELKSRYEEAVAAKPPVREDIPCYAIGFKGWMTPEAFHDNFDAASNLDGAVILDPVMGHFRGRSGVIQGDWTLSVFLDCIAIHINEVMRIEMPQSMNYAFGLISQLFTCPAEAMERLKDLRTK
jgi:hypothetical protein